MPPKSDLISGPEREIFYVQEELRLVKMGLNIWQLKKEFSRVVEKQVTARLC